MEGTREESVSTSLKELLRLEEERQCREEEEIARRAEMARVEREARERAALDAEEDKKKRAAEEREASAARLREAEEARQREAEEERRRTHERELARLRAGHAAPSPRSGLAIGMLAGTALTVALASAGYVGFLQPQMARANDATLRVLKERGTLREQVTQVERALTEERAKFASLQTELATARAHGERLERDLAEARRGQPVASVGPVVVSPPVKAPPPRVPERPCAPGDPLCP